MLVILGVPHETCTVDKSIYVLEAAEIQLLLVQHCVLFRISLMCKTYGDVNSSLTGWLRLATSPRLSGEECFEFD